jgi:hypothetical protein
MLCNNDYIILLLLNTGKVGSDQGKKEKSGGRGEIF